MPTISSYVNGAGGAMGFGYVNSTSGGNSGWGSGDTVMVILMGLLVAIAITALAALLSRRPQASATPLETLGARYARGEIDEPEYNRRRGALEPPSPDSVGRVPGGNQSNST